MISEYLLEEQMKKVITISREFGSGGHVIAKKAAEKLGIKYVDDDIIVRIAEETGFSEEFIGSHSEHAPGKSLFSYALIGRDSTGMSIQDRIMGLQTRIIQDIAEKDDCVIIGRCADFILRDSPSALHVFIYGNEKEKIERIKERDKKTDTEAVKLMKEMDKKRSVNYNYCTDRMWGDRKNYTLSLNSSILGYDKCVDIIARLYSEL